MNRPKLLSIVIPTFNRSKFLDKQINWAVRSIGQKWDDVELIICNNASTDETKFICDKWVQEFGSKIKVYHNEQNVGLVKNCILGLKRAIGDFVWLIGDDDPIDIELTSIVLNIIKNSKDLSAVFLNHRCIDDRGNVLVERFYKCNKDFVDSSTERKQLKTLLLENHSGGFMFITANVLRRNQALNFLEKFPHNDRVDLAYPLLINLGISLTNKFFFYNEPKIDCVYSSRATWNDKSAVLTYSQVPRVLFQLKKLGLPSNVLKSCIEHQFVYTPSFRATISAIKQKPSSLLTLLMNWLLIVRNKYIYKWKAEYL